MISSDKSLASELDELAISITAAVARIQALAADRAHVIRRDVDALDTVSAAGPKLSTALRTLAEHLETASCETVVFPNARCGIASVVSPAVSGYSVVIRDTDANRTLPTVHRFANRNEAIAKARHLAGV